MPSAIFPTVIQLVFVGLVFLPLEGRKAFALFRPSQGLEEGFVAVEARDDPGGHVPDLDAVSGLALSVDGDGQPAAVFIEREFRDVADVEFLAPGVFWEAARTIGSRGLQPAPLYYPGEI